jgi:hypothetical protein
LPQDFTYLLIIFTVMRDSTLRSVACVLSLMCAVDAHGYHPKAKDLTPDPDWATMHMAGTPPLTRSSNSFYFLTDTTSFSSCRRAPHRQL